MLNALYPLIPKQLTHLELLVQVPGGLGLEPDPVQARFTIHLVLTVILDVINVQVIDVDLQR